MDGKRALAATAVTTSTSSTTTGQAGEETVNKTHLNTQVASAAEGSPRDYGDWLQGPNPLGFKTEREVQNEAVKLPIYRCIYVRNDTPVTEDPPEPVDDALAPATPNTQE